MSYLSRLFFVLGLVAGLRVFAQEGDRAELLYTQRLSKRFPDSAFLLLREMYSQALVRKDRLGTGICLQQMGQICFYLGNFPKAIDFHGQADKLYREGGPADDERVAANLNDMGIAYYYNRQTPLAWSQYEEALGIYRRRGNVEGMADTYGVYSNGKEQRVKLLLNEREVRLPIGGGPYYSWKELRGYCIERLRAIQTGLDGDMIAYLKDLK
jgi:tetratricopeptide (TPR) repeat protein